MKKKNKKLNKSKAHFFLLNQQNKSLFSKKSQTLVEDNKSMIRADEWDSMINYNRRSLPRLNLLTADSESLIEDKLKKITL